ncbi:MAG TPA: NUDIX domain-containing protein [Candidatus Paceibacterota bacterium]
MVRPHIERSINSSFGLIRHEEQSLWLKREDNGLWELSGGGTNNDEFKHKGVLIREIEEEAGVKISEKKLRLYAVLGQRLHIETSDEFGGIQYGSLFLYYCNLPGKRPTVTLSHDHTDSRFFFHKEIMENWRDFSSGALWMYFTYLKFQETREIQEGLLYERRFWKRKKYFSKKK